MDCIVIQQHITIIISSGSGGRVYRTADVASAESARPTVAACYHTIDTHQQVRTSPGIQLIDLGSETKRPMCREASEGASDECGLTVRVPREESVPYISC